MVTAALGKAEIAALIPHAGSMCLLDAVVHWDSKSITCVASNQRDSGHPLASDGRLDAICGVEYAAQTMAIHGGLIAGRRPEAGYLASVRDVVCHTERLDTADGDLEVSATLLFGDIGGAVYGFVLRCGTETLLEGRAAVAIDARARSSPA